MKELNVGTQTYINGNIICNAMYKKQKDVQKAKGWQMNE